MIQLTNPYIYIYIYIYKEKKRFQIHVESYWLKKKKKKETTTTTSTPPRSYLHETTWAKKKVSPSLKEEFLF